MNDLIVLNESHKDLVNRSIFHDWSVPVFKAKHFIAGSQIHPLHKIKQYLMELGSRYENLENFDIEMKKLEIEIELELELKEKTDLIAKKKLHDLEIISKKKKLAIAKEKLKTAISELNKFIKLIDEFNNSDEGKDSKGTLYMDILNDPEECEKIEAQYWEYRLAKQAALDMIAYGRIGVGNMEAIMQLESDAQNKCLAMAYEVLITNESRMNLISDSVMSLLKHDKKVSNIQDLLQIKNTDFIKKLENQKQELEQNVPLIQKR